MARVAGAMRVLNTPPTLLPLLLLLLSILLAAVDATSNAIDLSASSSASCYWLPSSYGECDASCGAGTQSRSITCYCDDGATSDEMCADLIKPDPIASCSISCLSYEWSTTSWSGCDDLECGSAVSSRSVVCMGSNGMSIEPHYCAGSVPSENQACHAATADCSTMANATWNWGEWTACSASCGAGHETRDRWCIGQDGVVDDTNCDCDSMPTYRECNLGACEVLEWVISSSTECSVTCGTGFVARTVTCVSSSRGVVASTECDSETRPEQVQLCKNEPCPTYSWDPTGFVCSVTCGNGVATQTVNCIADLTGEIVDESYCSGVAPPTSEACKAEVDCRVCTWATTELSECSSTCGLGEQSREVSCSCSDGSVDDSLTLCEGTMPEAALTCEAACPVCHLVPDEWAECSATCGTDGVETRNVKCYCDGELKALDFVYCPTALQSMIETAQSCNVRDCPVYTWTASGFGLCSVTCSSGYRTQTVTCVDQLGNQVEDSFCDAATMPDEMIACQAATNCTGPYPRSSALGPCSASCGSGFATADVWCEEDGVVVDISLCSNLPDATVSCTRGACEVIGWTFTDWDSSCSSTCNGGVVTRVVRCESDQRGIISDSECDADTRPVSIEDCNEEVVCPVYQWSSQWSACSTTCGAGVKTLAMTCIEVTSNTTVDDGYCSDRSAIQSVQVCSELACEIFEWHTGDWECSVTCGAGVSVRSVTCVGSYGTVDLTNTKCVGVRPEVLADCYPSTCPSYEWKISDFGTCSAVCGSGIQTHDVWCEETTTHTVVNNTLCSAALEPASWRSCEVAACASASNIISINWVVGDWGVCDVECGSGTHERTLTCVQTVTVHEVDGNVTVTVTVMDPAYCTDAVMPERTETCETGITCEYPYWLPGTYGNCSADCGDGTKTRTVVCWDPNTSSAMEDDRCSTMAKPATEESCTDGPCETWEWQVSTWSNCSAECGTGFKTRVVTCVSSQKGVVAYSFCPAATQPSDFLECSAGVECVTCSWARGAWSDCSATCGVGLRSRDVTCSCSDGSTDAASCASLTAYPSTKTCIETNLCEAYQWVNTTAWSECSAECGTGVITRNVACVGEISGAVDATGLQCISETIASSMVCEAGECEVFGWQYGNWSSCSVTCGFGTQSRSKTCVGSWGTIDLTGVKCSESEAGATGRDCFPRTCEVCTWQVGTLGECGVTCGNGVQMREVACVGNRGTVCDASECSGTAPESTVVCELACCTTYSWYVGAYGSCSVTCGTGTKSRDVYCHDAEGLVVDASYCSGTHPGYDTECDAAVECTAPSWTNGEWSDCSSSCGSGTRTRSVWCESVAGVVMDDSACSGTAPSATSECNLCACETTSWEVSSWSDCSVTCGTGFQTRSTDCRSTLRGYVPSTECSDSAVVDHQACTNVCYSWVAGAWGDCVDGIYTRNVYCVGTNGRIDTTGALCTEEEQPTDTGVCA